MELGGRPGPDGWSCQAKLHYECSLRPKRRSPLTGEANRVAPLPDIFNLFALIGPVNQFRRMVYQAHCGFPRHSGTAQPIHIRHPETVKTKVRHLELDEKLLPTPRRLKGEDQCLTALLRLQILKDRSQRARHRNGENPVFAAVETWERDFVFLEKHAIERKSRFAQTDRADKQMIALHHFDTWHGPSNRPLSLVSAVGPDHPRRSHAAPRHMPNCGHGGGGTGTSQISRIPNPAAWMSRWRARINHAFTRHRKTTLSATCMALFRKARNFE
jgi:hypothetical protein